MKFSLFTQNSPLNSPPIWTAVKSGLIKLGHIVDENNINTDIPVIWSLLWHGRMAKNKFIWEKFRSTNKKVLVVEVGGIIRNKTWKIGINGINRSAEFGPKENNDTRSKQLGLTLRPWRKQGDHILICLQHTQSEQWKDMPSLEKYVIDIVSKLPVRPPLENVEYEIPKQIANTYDDFDLNFTNAWAVISHSSNPGIHAVLNGIPAYVGEHSLAYEVANTDLSTIESPEMPERQQWLNDYAYTEWTDTEIASGLPFSRLTF
jgi:hypothetical protein